jgi:sulfite exporter TauE/SafE
MSELLYLSIFTSALVSGWHCAMMCGGVASWAESRVVRMVSPKQMWLEQLVMHLCRVVTYMLLGGVAGHFGAIIWQQDALPVQRGMFLVASGILILQAYFLFFGVKKGKNRQFRLGSWSFFDKLEKKAGIYWAKLVGRLNQRSLSNNWLKRIGIGLVWGLIPCGLVYSVLPLAFLSGSFTSGALLMGAMGLGTLPNLLMISGLVGQLAGRLVQAGHEVWMRRLAAGLMLLTGILGIYHALTLSESFLKNGFCFS